ncbi:MAG: hypothetical protein MZV64_61590 [Ignavibacteriales bacterium]|nr:hypothetical protein [Ignavibacteriales bacterium]
MKTKSERKSSFMGNRNHPLKRRLTSLNDKQFTRRLICKRLHSLWKDDPKVSAAIKNRLGWLGVENFMNKVDEVNEFVKNVRTDKYSFVVLLGMGGSSLCPEVALADIWSKERILKTFCS